MSAAADTSPAAKGATFRCGTELREARERLGWDLAEIASALRIRLPYLQALEDGQLSALPGNTYALGFLRTYATALGLDADELARRFRAEASDVNRRPVLSFPAPVPERGIPTGAAVLIGLVFLVIVYVVWFRYSDHESAPSRTVPPVPAQLLASPRPAPISPQVASVMPTTPPPGVAPPGADAAVRPEAAPPVSPSAPAMSGPAVNGAPSGAPVATTPPGAVTSVAPAGAPNSATPAGAPTSATPAGVPGSAPAAGAVAAPGSAGVPTPAAAPAATPATAAPLVLVASAPTWVQVRSADGRLLYDHVLQAGETWSPPAGETGLLLTTGNAGGLSITRSGVAGPVLGRDGAVLRHVALDGPVNGPVAAGTASPGVPTPPTTAGAPTAATAVATAPPPGSGAVAPTPRRHHVKPSAPVDADDSADRLNARQLAAHH